MTAKSEKKNECEKKLLDAETKAQEYLDMARRVQADFENYRKRTAKENDEFRKYASADVVAEILTIADDMERALSFAEDSELKNGIKAIHNNLIKLLQSRGVTEIDVSGKFDPNVHEALCTCEGENDNDIVEVFQKGYRMGDRILRCPKVKVTKAKQEEGEQDV